MDNQEQSLGSRYSYENYNLPLEGEMIFHANLLFHDIIHRERLLRELNHRRNNEDWDSDELEYIYQTQTQSHSQDDLESLESL